MLLTDLADACRKSGLRVVELPGWRSNISGGSFDPAGVLCHHTGSFDAIADAADDDEYARWLAFVGRSDLPAPLCNLALSAESVVYVCSSGNANHAGQARPSGPMGAASDGNALYVGIEAMNSGSQGWGSKGRDADGNEVTQGEGYARLCAALCGHYGWPASHVRAHRETSVTGKPDPGLLNMDDFRADVARHIDNPQEDDMQLSDEYADGKKVGSLFRRLDRFISSAGGRLKGIEDELEAVQADVADDATQRKLQRVLDSVRGLRAEVDDDEAGDGSA